MLCYSFHFKHAAFPCIASGWVLVIRHTLFLHLSCPKVIGAKLVCFSIQYLICKYFADQRAVIFSIFGNLYHSAAVLFCLQKISHWLMEENINLGSFFYVLGRHSSSFSFGSGLQITTDWTSGEPAGFPGGLIHLSGVGLINKDYVFYIYLHILFRPWQVQRISFYDTDCSDCRNELF